MTKAHAAMKSTPCVEHGAILVTCAEIDYGNTIANFLASGQQSP